MSLEVIISIIENNWPAFLRGAYITLLIAVVSTIIGALIGFVIGILNTLPVKKKSVQGFISKSINAIFTAYVEFFRGTPMIVQAMLIYYGTIGVLGFDIDKLLAAIIIVSLNTGAYMAEIVRGGIVSIDNGQYEAAQAIGMNHTQAMLFVVLPQVARNILPATGNQLIMNIKDTAVLSVISVTELFFATKSIAGANFYYAESFLVACVLYFVMTFTASLLLRLLEKKLDGPSNYKVEVKS